MAKIPSYPAQTAASLAGADQFPLDHGGGTRSMTVTEMDKKWATTLALAAVATGNFDFVEGPTPSATGAGETWLDITDPFIPLYVSTGSGTGNWGNPVIEYMTYNNLTGVINNTTKPLLDYDLSHDTRKIIRGEGSDTFTRSTVMNITDRYGLVKEIAIDSTGAEKNGTKFNGEGSNKVLHTEDLTDVLWLDPTVGWSAVGDNVTDPKGTTTADTITISGTSAVIRQSLTAADNSSASMWVKVLTGSVSALAVDHGDGAGMDISSQLVSGEWVRCKAEGLVKGASDWLDISVTCSAGTTLSIWGIQFEEFDFVSTYMKNIGAIVPRTVDSLSLQVNDNVNIANDGLTIIVDITIDGYRNANGFYLLNFGGTTEGIIQISSTKIFYFSNGVASSVSHSINLGIPVRIGLVLDSASVSYYVDSELLTRNTIRNGSTTKPSKITISDVNFPLYGNISNIEFIPRPLSEQEMRVK